MRFQLELLEGGATRHSHGWIVPTCNGTPASVEYDPVLASLRGDPRYKLILVKMKLPV